MSADAELKRARDALFAASRALDDAHRARFAGSSCKCGGHGPHAERLLHECRLADRALQRAAIRFSAALAAVSGIGLHRFPDHIADLSRHVEDPPLPDSLKPEPPVYGHNPAYDLGLLGRVIQAESKLDRAERYWSGRAARDIIEENLRIPDDRADALVYGVSGSVSWRNQIDQTAVEVAPGQYRLEVPPNMARLIAACKAVIDEIHANDGKIVASARGLEMLRERVRAELWTNSDAPPPEVEVEYKNAGRWVVRALGEEVELR